MLHYFWTISPSCLPQRSLVSGLSLSRDFLEAQLRLSLGNLSNAEWRYWRWSLRAFGSTPSAARGCTMGRLIPVLTHCLRAGAKGCSLALRSGLVTVIARIPRISACPATAAYAPPSPTTGVMPFILCSWDFGIIFSAPCPQPSLSTVSVYNCCAQLLSSPNPRSTPEAAIFPQRMKQFLYVWF